MKRCFLALLVLLTAAASVAVLSAAPASATLLSCTPGYTYSGGIVNGDDIESIPGFQGGGGSNTVVCLDSYINSTPSASSNNKDAVIGVPAGVTLQRASSTAYPICYCRFDSDRTGRGTVNYDGGYPYQMQTAQAYYRYDSYTNQTIADLQAAGNANDVSLPSGWTDDFAASSTEVVKALPSNSDRRINVTSPQDGSVSTDEHTASFTISQTNSTDNSSDAKVLATCQDWTSGTYNAAGTTFFVPTQNVTDDDQHSTNLDTLGSFQTKDQGDENEGYYDGVVPTGWATSNHWNFWEVTGDGGADNGEEDTWTSGAPHPNNPDASTSYVQKACTGFKLPTGSNGTGSPGVSRGSGLGFMGNTVRGYEAQNGINHPIGWELSGNSNCHIAPATKDDTGNCTTYNSSEPLYGLRLKLSASKISAVEAACSPSSCMNTGQRNVWDAIKKYGFITVDQGSQHAYLSFSRRGIASAGSGESYGDLGYYQNTFGGTSGSSPHFGDKVNDSTTGVPRFGITRGDLRVVCNPEAITAGVPSC